MNDCAERKTIPQNVHVYELTIAEFPLFIFSSAPKKIKDEAYYEYRDQIRGKSGPVERVWKLHKDSVYGYPNESTFSTLYEIIQIWKEQGFSSRYINFGSYANLIHRKGQKHRPNRDDYERIKKDLGCLRGIRISAKNAFWDPKRNQYVDKDFNLFNEITTFKDSPNSKNSRETIIEASQTFFNSVNSCLFVTEIDSSIIHSLPPLAGRLALYLSKIFKYQKVHKRSLLEFSNQLPTHAKQFKHKKQAIIRACESVIKNNLNLLDSYDFEPLSKRPKDEYIVFFSARPQKNKNGNPKPHSQFPKESFEIDNIVNDILEVCKDTRSTGFYRKVAYYMPADDVYQALSEVKEVILYSKSSINIGAVFTNRIKSLAGQRNIEVFDK